MPWGKVFKHITNPLQNPTPIHPDILDQMNTHFNVGDLVETNHKSVGIIKAINESTKRVQFIFLVPIIPNILLCWITLKRSLLVIL